MVKEVKILLIYVPSIPVNLLEGGVGGVVLVI